MVLVKFLEKSLSVVRRVVLNNFWRIKTVDFIDICPKLRTRLSLKLLNLFETFAKNEVPIIKRSV